MASILPPPAPPKGRNPREELATRLRRMAAHLNLLNNPQTLALRINFTLAREGHLKAIVRRRFETEGMSQGARWVFLARPTRYQRWLQGYNPDSPILRRSGTLMKAATTGPELATAKGITLQFKDGPAPVYRYGKSGKAKKSKSKLLSSYAGVLNNGGSRIPARPFFGPPTRTELQALAKRRSELIRNVVNRILTGNSLTPILKKPK